ncbi:5'-methylthioadenosine/adenosylhomocysteine nucleosidase [Clostridium sp. LIBA-8841]|uniref:5'-methylthioadenosine/adenosylhomocysteine nucleosidase n=1 Tax=Clostridium sp. LIBA-8841 TaxID=2987530 RepID=UPI002AC5CD76|nr:5'-methylthioadenosine/adenosylhomocysteine nucleosidase [Clostridium sp. LIBA-8841]MDZ5253623.1 5'-methylthioadenosine/adenosylhomocysteine nucleosidase [Clostridium sp. LIBA-8841]
MRIGIIGPSEEEIMPFIENISAKKTSTFAMLNFYSGNFKGVDVVSLYCGVCKVNAAIAAQLLIDKFNVTHIIVTGVAGGIDKRLNIGDTVISIEVAYHDVEEGILTEYHPWMRSVYFKGDKSLLEICKKLLDENTFAQKIYFGKIVTGETFINNDIREEIIHNFNPICVDMETGSIAHVCYVNKIPFLAIRSITDTENESGIEVFENNCEMASLNSIEIVKKILEFISQDINL